MDTQRALKAVIDWCLLHGDAPTQEAARHIEEKNLVEKISMLFIAAPIGNSDVENISVKDGEIVIKESTDPVVVLKQTRKRGSK